nr:Fur family transcriptional regulator [Prevotella sp.]
MTDDVKAKVKKVLDEYLEACQHRKTPERYAILDAVYSIDKHFTLEELGEYLIHNGFRVSRATLYNTIHLFVELRLVVRHGLAQGTKYEASLGRENHVHQVCTACGAVTDIDAPLVTMAISNTQLHNFHCDEFALYIYGLCASCQSCQKKRQ